MTASTISTETITPDSAPRHKEYLNIQRSEWKYPVLYLLCLSMVGFQFPPAFLLIVVCLIHAWRHDRYDFLLLFTLTLGGYGLSNVKPLPGMNMFAFAFFGSILGVALFRKNRIINKTLAAWVGYALILLALAHHSLESMSIQLPTVFKYLSFIYFIVPLIVFSKREFDIKVLYRKVIIYSLIISIFYLIDAFVLKGHVLVSQVKIWEDIRSTFFSPILDPLSFEIPRKYPPGLYIYAMAVFPIAKYYKLTTWQWVVVVLALFCTRTFTFITGVVFAYIIFQGKFGKLMKYALFGALALTALYFIDASMGIANNENNETNLRIKSSIDQIINLEVAEDDEDVSALGSGRLAQAIPKLQLLFDEDREWTGLGFLSPDKTNVKKYIIYNEFYVNTEKSEEVAATIEIIALQVFLNIGYIGLAAHILFFVLLWLFVRKLPNAKYFLSVMVVFLWLGIGGFEGLIRFMGLYMVAIAYAAVLLSNRSTLGGFALPDKESKRTA